ncbi:MAG: DMT family transporter [Lachnospiraceae bacterium]
MGMIMAILSGALMSVQGVFNSEVTKQSSLWVSAGFVQLTAFVVCFIMWAITGREPISALSQVHPKYMLLGGVIGAFITITVIQAMNSLGPARAAMLIVVAQLIVAYGIELFGMFGVEQSNFEWKKLFGMLLAIGGIILFKWK